MSLIRKIYLVSSFVFLYTGLFGQTDCSTNELIVQFNSTGHINRLLSAYTSNSDIHVKKVLFKEGNICLLSIPDDGDPNAWIENLKRDGFVKYAIRNCKVEFRNQNLPNDELFNTQYYLDLIGVTDVWALTKGGFTATGDTIVIAIPDEGFDVNHPDLLDNLYINKREIPGNGIDDDENGYIDDYIGYYPRLNNDKHPVNTHGTSVAGIIGAKGNNGIGVTGINWNVKLMYLSVGTIADIIKGYEYIYNSRKLYNETNGEKGAFVVASNSSFGYSAFPSSKPDLLMWCEMYDVMGSVGILSVGATTNENVDVGVVGDVPSGCESDYLIVVTSSGEYDGLGLVPRGFNNKYVDLSAPGERLVTTGVVSNQSNYTSSFGANSGASPMVTGAIGLLASLPFEDFAKRLKEEPAQSALYLKEIILSTVKPLAPFQGRTLTEGRLDVKKAMEKIAEEYGFVFSYNFAFNSVFPNPCCQDGKLYFTFENLDFETNELEIYNMQGVRIYHQDYRPLDYVGGYPYVDLNSANVPYYVPLVLVMRRDARMDAKLFIRYK